MLDSKSAVYMDKNGKDTKHTRHIERRVHFVRNDEKCKIQNIDWCEGDLQLANIANNNFCEHDLTPIMKYIMARLENWDRTLVHKGWQGTWYSMEQEFYMTRIDWVDDLTQSVWNVCIKFDTWKEHWKLSVIERKRCCSEWKTELRENHVNGESNSLDITI